MKPAMLVDRRHLLLAGLTGLAFAMPRPAGAVAGPAVPMTVRNNRLFIPARINGQQVLALLDSAAEMTVLDLGFARRLGLIGGTAAAVKGSGAGRVEALMVDHVVITAPGMAARASTAAVIDLTDVARRLNGAALPVILGRDYLDHVRLQIDIRRRRLRPLATAEQPKGMQLPLTTLYGVETLAVVAEGIAAQATVDLGNGNDPLVSRAFASKIGALSDGRAIGEDRGGGIGGEAVRQRFVLKSLTIGGKTFADLPVVVDAGENAADLNLGTSIFGHFQLVTDFARHRLWLQQF